MRRGGASVLYLGDIDKDMMLTIDFGFFMC